MISPPSSASRRVSRASRSAARAWCRLLAKFFRIENDMLKSMYKIDTKEKDERVCASESQDQRTGTYRLQGFMAINHEPYMSWLGPRWCRHPAIPKDTIKLRGKWRNNLNSSQPLNLPPCLCFITSHLALCLHLHLKQKSSRQDLLDLLCSMLRCAKRANLYSPQI